MFKRQTGFSIFLIAVCAAPCMASSNSAWTWVNGAKIYNEQGVYGAKGATDPNNVPGPRESSISWADGSGNLWLFGGNGYGASGSAGYLNDLWKFDGTDWTWISGSDATGQPGVYGTKGVADPNNIPGARQDSVSWIDANGNLWLFGGNGFNDLWKFDGTNWTWVSGSNATGQRGVYGTKGVADPNNIPGARSEAVCWTDADGNLWLFGGYGYGASGSSWALNDLWKFDGANWTWVSGSSSVGQSGDYGMKGVANPDNVPGARYECISWTDASGNLWLFGGWGFGADTSGVLNDLWKFDGVNWTWVSGSSLVGQSGVYGTKGVAGLNNVPGARYECISWTDASGDLWLFGGQGYGQSASGTGYLNDLWKFDGTTWTWVSGSDGLDNRNGVYGTKGVADPNNVPGARRDSVSWIDASGNLWLFGGNGFNDLWKFDGTNWTWVSGSSASYNYGVYGIQGVAASGNAPGSRNDSVSRSDSGGNLWLFGGYGYATSTAGRLNDLWKFDGTNWTWVSGSHVTNQPGVYGTKGVAAQGNVPGARSDLASWSDNSGNLWLFGGLGYVASGVGYLNDLWKFDGTNWTWVSGSSAKGQLGVYGAKGVAAPSNVPGSRANSSLWIDGSGNLWLFGGYGYGQYSTSAWYQNDLWKFDGVNWTWVSGSDISQRWGIYGTKGLAAPSNVPGAREGCISWVDGSGNLWLFGGQGYTTNDDMGRLNDLWKFDGTNWTWVSGSDDTGQPGVYGAKGVAAPSNVPGARTDSVSWSDSSGNLWLFGGDGYATSGNIGRLNDLWKFDGTNWTWISGSEVTNQYGVYGTKGVAASGNVPGARDGLVSWTDASGRLWLFGGQGYATSDNISRLNDLWKFGIPEEAADMTGDGVVEELDLMMLADQWLSAPGEPSADLAPNPVGDGIVNFRDFAVLAGKWREGR